MKKTKGFTIIELLTVIAVIALLTAILVPTVSRVRDSAKRTQTRAQFSQWITAIEMFRTEYGYWPDFRSTGPDWEALPLNADNNLVIRLENPIVQRNFFEFLSGRHADGTGFEPAFLYERHPNRRRISFYDFSESDYRFTGDDRQINKAVDNVELIDSYENGQIVIVMDGDRNGIITLKDNADYRVRNPLSTGGVPPQGVAPYSTQAPKPYSYTGAAREVRASVIIFSPGKEARSEQEAYGNMIRSW